MIDWTKVAILLGLAGFAVAIFWVILQRAERTSAEIQAYKDRVAGAKAEAEVVKKSNESAEAADSRRDPSLHTVPDVMHGTDLPAWLRRD